jgi:NAD(P)-dependent dehydrogenase (short-subunit alcohol dehydrogenase family)
MGKNRVVAVTGAGQGIGLGVTGALCRRGFDVLALVLEESMAEAVERAVHGSPGAARVEVLDVTDPADFAFPDDLWGLVNNAGIRRAYLPIEMSDPVEWRSVFDVNFFGLVEMTRRAVPVMRARGDGVICNISSGSLFSAIPFLAPYRTSKAAVSAFCECLRVEVAPFGIRVVEILPGATVSGINADSVLRRIADAVDFPPYAPMAERQWELNRTAAIEATPAEDVGEAIVDALTDDDGPMRYGSDEMSRQLLADWRTVDDEVQMRSTVARMTGDA